MSAKVRVFARADLHDAIGSILPTASFADLAKRGSLLEAVATGEQVVGIVDGAFARGLSITNAEIYQAIQCGLTVLGCNGIGALRAVELQHLGMIGVGAAFQRALRSSRFEDQVIASETSRRQDALAMAKRIATILAKAERQRH